MSSIPLGRDVRAGQSVSPARAATRVAFLASGAIASGLYVATDVLAGRYYEGYSFYSQTISELGAVGAPKPAFLAPLFLAYDLLMVAFAIAVLREGLHGNRRVRIVGGLLLTYLLVGSGTAFFPVHVRGTARFADELPHIITGLMAIVAMAATMIVGSTALGSRFRTFSLAMLATMVGFGALTVPFALRLARGETTPGMGLVERAAYYAILAWVAVLSVALARRVRSAGV